MEDKDKRRVLEGLERGLHRRRVGSAASVSNPSDVSSFVAGFLSATKLWKSISPDFEREIWLEYSLEPLVVEQVKDDKGAQKPDIGEPDRAGTSGDGDKPIKAGSPWSLEEEAALRESFELGATISDLAQSHQRSEIAIGYRLERLGLISDRDVAPESARSEAQPQSKTLDPTWHISHEKLQSLLLDMRAEIQAPPGSIWEFGGGSWMEQVGHDHDKARVRNASAELAKEMRELLRSLRETARTDDQKKVCSRALEEIRDKKNLVLIAKLLTSLDQGSEDIFKELEFFFRTNLDV